MNTDKKKMELLRTQLKPTLHKEEPLLLFGEEYSVGVNMMVFLEGYLFKTISSKYGKTKKINEVLEHIRDVISDCRYRTIMIEKELEKL